jgi:hypothetical protein
VLESEFCQGVSSEQGLVNFIFRGVFAQGQARFGVLYDAPDSGTRRVPIVVSDLSTEWDAVDPGRKG